MWIMQLEQVLLDLSVKRTKIYQFNKEKKILKAFNDLFKYVTQSKRNWKLRICQVSMKVIPAKAAKPINVHVATT